MQGRRADAFSSFAAVFLVMVSYTGHSRRFPMITLALLSRVAHLPYHVSCHAAYCGESLLRHRAGNLISDKVSHMHT